MINSSLLDACSDEELKEVSVLVDKILKHRDDERKSEAIERARALLASAGLKLEDLVKAKKKPNGVVSYNGGHTYQHPTDKSLMWHAKGKKPKWLSELEANGVSPIEVVNDKNRMRPSNDNGILVKQAG